MPGSHRTERTLACVLFGLLISTGAEAQRAPVDIDAIRLTKIVTAARISEPIRVDGTLDEHAWELATPAGDFYQQQPAEFELATRRTEVRFLYDDTTFYVGAVMYDPEPDRLITNDLKRDFTGRDGDAVGLILDTFQDRRSAYGFQTNPGGALRDSLAFDNGRRNDGNWHGIWFVKTAIRPDGWSAEFAIPFKTLRFPERDVQEWGLNIVRFARRANEISMWAPVPRQFTHYNVVYAGRLTGIRDAQPGKNLQIKPFVTGGVGRGTFGRAGWDGDGDGGIDLKMALTSSLLLDGTWRTDFSQVEADEQQINLTRFSLFFPEKREFFLEGPTAFQIGLIEPDAEDPRRDLVPFFSRRIGLSSDGRPIPVVAGARVTGRQGATGVGLLNMQTEDFEGRPGDNFTAIRMSRDLNPAVSVAGFYFGREAGDSPDFNRVGGFDVRLHPARTLEVEAFGMRSETDGEAGDWAGRAGFRIDQPGHRARALFLHVGDGFQHDLGFVRRRGVGLLFGRYARVFKPANTASRIREHSVGVDFENTTDDQYHTLLTRIGGLNYGTLFADGGELKAWATTTREIIGSSFGVGPVLVVPAGEYSFEDAGVEYISNKSAVFSGSVKVGAGEFWSGRQRLVGGSLRVRFNAHIAASSTLSRSVITLPEGDFTADLVGLRLDWSFTPRMFLNALIQYNGESDTWTSNVRYNFMHRPLSDIYVVWNETRLTTQTRRALLLKYTHLLSF